MKRKDLMSLKKVPMSFSRPLAYDGLGSMGAF